MPRIGPKMQSVINFVRDNPGCAKIDPARWVAPNGSLKYGYATVDRCIRAGLLKARWRDGRSYSLEVAS